MSIKRVDTTQTLNPTYGRHRIGVSVSDHPSGKGGFILYKHLPFDVECNSVREEHVPGSNLNNISIDAHKMVVTSIDNMISLLQKQRVRMLDKIKQHEKELSTKTNQLF